MDIAAKPVAAKAGVIVRGFIWETKYQGTSSMTGWRPLLIPQFDPGTPFHVAHDTLEHLDPADPSLEAEMRAFGATLFFRGEGDYWERKFRKALGNDPLAILYMDIDTDPAVRVARDFFSFLTDDTHVLAEPPKAIPLRQELEQTMINLLEIGKKKHKFGLTGNSNDAHQDWTERVERAFGWMRIGYRNHERLYKKLTPHQRAGFYLAIEEVAYAITMRTSYDVAPGDRLTVTVDTNSLIVSAKIHDKNGHVAARKQQHID